MTSHYTPAYSLPMRVPTKGGHYNSGYSSAYSVSPPEVDDELSSNSGVASYSNPSYAESGDYESSHSASGIDFNEYMQDRFATSFNPIPLDQSMVTQAKTSGKLNAKHRELAELQKKAQARLAKTRERFQDGLRDAREVREDLEWTEKKLKTLKTKASRKHPNEYTKARTRYPTPE